MDTYALQRIILKMDLLPGERYVGMVLALHLNQKTETIQVRQKTLIEETGYSRNTIQKALQRLIASGVFSSRQTGRAAVLVLGNNTGNMDTPNTGHQLPQKLGYRRKRKSAPFDLDTSLSTRIEEQNKRDEKGSRGNRMKELSLTPKQARFAQEYLVDLNGTQAAIRAGYSQRTANEQAARLLTKASVQEAIQKGQQERQKRTLVTVDYVVTSLREVAERCMQKAPVYNTRGEQVVDEEGRSVWRFDSSGANRALELLGKHVNAFGERKDDSSDEIPVAIQVQVVNGRRAE